MALHGLGTDASEHIPLDPLTGSHDSTNINKLVICPKYLHPHNYHINHTIYNRLMGHNQHNAREKKTTFQEAGEL
jgi:hypothetical protein